MKRFFLFTMTLYTATSIASPNTDLFEYKLVSINPDYSICAKTEATQEFGHQLRDNAELTGCTLEAATAFLNDNKRPAGRYSPVAKVTILGEDHEGKPTNFAFIDRSLTKPEIVRFDDITMFTPFSEKLNIDNANYRANESIVDTRLIINSALKVNLSVSGGSYNQINCKGKDIRLINITVVAKCLK